jgi:hypothetical protein
MQIWHIIGRSRLSNEVAMGHPARFLAAFLAAAAGFAIALLVGLVVVDPYGTGRFLPKGLDRSAALGANPAFSSAARLRDQRFDAFIFGNSTLQTLDPERLSRLTGHVFAQVTVPGTGPLEQGTMLRHASRIRSDDLKVAVLGIDLNWCNPELAKRGKNPFPLWLYEESSAGFLSGLFRFNTIEAMPRRIAFLRGMEAPPRADGYWNYELHVPPRPYPYGTPRAPRFATQPHSAAETLRSALNTFRADTHVVVILTPLYRSPVETASFDEATGVAACRAEIQMVLGNRPRTSVIDGWRDTAFNRDRSRFLDAVHFREPVARDIEASIAAALKSEQK